MYVNGKCWLMVEDNDKGKAANEKHKDGLASRKDTTIIASFQLSVPCEEERVAVSGEAPSEEGEGAGCFIKCRQTRGASLP